MSRIRVGTWYEAGAPSVEDETAERETTLGIAVSFDETAPRDDASEVYEGRKLHQRWPSRWTEEGQIRGSVCCGDVV